MKKSSLVFLLFISLLFLPVIAAIEDPTTIYGQVLVGDRPYENLPVTARWMDSNGLYHETTASTLTKTDAIKYGSSYFTGYYFFDNGMIHAKEGSYIIITLAGIDHKFLVPSSPGEEVKVTTISLNFEQFYGEVNYTEDPDKPEEPEDDLNYGIFNIPVLETNLTPLQQQGEELKEKEEPTQTIDTATGAKNNTEDQDIPLPDYEQKQEKENNWVGDVFFALVIILMIALGLVIIYFIIKISTNYIATVASGISLDPVKNKSRRFVNMKVNSVYKELIPLSKNIEYAEALNLIVKHKTESLIVVDPNKKYEGFVSEDDFLHIAYGFDKTKYDLNVEHFMSKQKNIISGKATIEEASLKMISEKISKLAVELENNIVGEITLFQIQKQIQDFAMHFKSGSASGLSTVRDIMDEKVEKVDKSEKVDKVRSIMLKKSVNFIVITEEEKPMGIFTTRDYVIGLYKFHNDLFKQDIGSLMSSSIVSINPDLNIFESNEYMLRKEYKNYPVMYDNEILGVLTQEKLFSALLEYIQKTLTK